MGLSWLPDMGKPSNNCAIKVISSGKLREHLRNTFNFLGTNSIDIDSSNEYNVGFTKKEVAFVTLGNIIVKTTLLSHYY